MSKKKIFFKEEIKLPIEGRFIRTIVKDLQELRSPEVEHELRVEGEVVGQAKTVWIVFAVLTEFLTLQVKCKKYIWTCPIVH
jgi:hypothetical protein